MQHRSKAYIKISGYFAKIDATLFIAVLFVLAVSPLPLGANRGWAYLALSGICFILVAIYLSSILAKVFFLQKGLVRRTIDPAIVLILLVSLWFYLQASLALPLPFLATISPATAEIYKAAYNILQKNEINQYATMSLDPGESYDKSIISLMCFSVIFLTGQLVNTRQRMKVFFYVVILSGVFQAVFGVLMTVTGKEYLLFIKKTDYIGNATGTFVNRNSLAGYLEMTLSVGVGFLLGLRKPEENNIKHWRGFLRFLFAMILSQVALLRGMLIIMVVGLLMTHSRMGNAAFFNALLLTGGIALLVSKEFRKPGFYFILISIVLIDVYLLGSLFDLDKVVNRIETTMAEAETRDELVQSALKMIPDFWLVGSGAGSFGYIFPAYKLQFIDGWYKLAHNDYLQIFIEAGLIGSILLALYLLIAIKRALALLRSGRDSFSRGVGFATVMTIICLLIHSSVDFNLQIPANILLFTTILAMPRIASNVAERTKTVRLYD